MLQRDSVYLQTKDILTQHLSLTPAPTYRASHMYHSTQYTRCMITTDPEDITNPFLANIISQTTEPYHSISIVAPLQCRWQSDLNIPRLHAVTSTHYPQLQTPPSSTKSRPQRRLSLNANTMALSCHRHIMIQHNTQHSIAEAITKCQHILVKTAARVYS